MKYNLRLSEHFTLQEFLKSDTAKKNGIENSLDYENSLHDAQVVFNLMRLCQLVLEPLRAHFGKAIPINSGYRCAELNKAVGGVENSLHLQGRAADIPFKPCYLSYIRDHLPHKELINEGTWIHVGL